MVARYGEKLHAKLIEHTLDAWQMLHCVPHHIARDEYRFGRIVLAVVLGEYRGYGRHNIAFETIYLRLGLCLAVAQYNKVKSCIISLLRYAKLRRCKKR